MDLSMRKNDETPMAATIEASNLSVTTKELTMKSIATTESVIKQGMQAIIHSGVPVITTEQLANFYGCTKNNIKKNYSCNASRFTEGKHYFVISGLVLKELKNSVTFGNSVDKRAPKLTLWTERGAARHAKMLETNRAWDVYEQLEDCYFNQKEKVEYSRKKTTVDERTPLRDAVNMLVGKKGLRYDDAYTMVHQRFNIDSIDELSLEQIPLAVEYIHRVVLEGEFLGKQASLPSPKLDINFPLSWFVENAPYTVIRQQSGDTVALDRSALVDCSPAYKLISALTKAGYDVSAVSAELKALRTIMAEQSWAMKEMASYVAVRDKACHRISL